ncbi:hypothetical protein L0F81_25050 [Streptomyces tricolor]|uniref:Uncharacterized protein n=1 Tax=Streptomyces tricolor TaxID=68277 RepID=A0ABS9JLU5_9ACTN|nr:hypothetical protein [Streptomyces tricolor]MCG0066511.1 hypothetical protein [Streptomyces tricolor]
MNLATELRTAAQTLRDLAARATHENRRHWTTGNTLGSRSPVVIDHPEQPSVLIETWAARLEAVNRYIAAMDPAVGTLLAQLLDVEADVVAARTAHDGTEAYALDYGTNRLLDIARLINGTTEETA